jgi:hypothetical protein
VISQRPVIELPLADSAIEARVKRLIEDFTGLIRHALSTPAARRQLSCDPGMAAELGHLLARTGGDAALYRNPRQLEKMSRQFARMLLPEPKRRCGD